MATLQKNRTKTAKPQRSYLAFVLLPLILLAVYYIFCTNKHAADAVLAHFSLPVRRFLGKITTLIPFSVAEIFYILLVIWALFFIVRSVYVIIRSKNSRLKALLKRIIILILVPLYILAGYTWLWSVGYYGSDFSDKSGLVSGGVAYEDLVKVTTQFANLTNELSDKVARDESGIFAEDMDAYFADAGKIYDGIKGEFEFLDGPIMRPKKVLFSKFMSTLGFTGFYFPFTGEANLNVDSPSCMIPSTIAHELAHQKGIASEDEANFVAVAACLKSGLTVYEYSGVLSGLSNLLNSLYTVDKNAWQDIFDSLSFGVRADFTYSSEYWRNYSSIVSDAAETFYDGYLRANNQQLGIKSYGACTDLIVEYYK